MRYILSFCAACGVLLPVGIGNEEDPRCPNCDASVDKREDRIEGEFEEEEAEKLMNVTG